MKTTGPWDPLTRLLETAPSSTGQHWSALCQGHASSKYIEQDSAQATAWLWFACLKTSKSIQLKIGKLGKCSKSLEMLSYLKCCSQFIKSRTTKSLQGLYNSFDHIILDAMMRNVLLFSSLRDLRNAKICLKQYFLAHYPLS